jgi:hypothetical protein
MRSVFARQVPFCATQILLASRAVPAPVSAPRFSPAPGGFFGAQTLIYLVERMEHFIRGFLCLRRPAVGLIPPVNQLFAPPAQTCGRSARHHPKVVAAQLVSIVEKVPCPSCRIGAFQLLS